MKKILKWVLVKIPVAFIRLFAPPKQSEAKREAARLQMARLKDAIREKTTEKQEEA